MGVEIKVTILRFLYSVWNGKYHLNADCDKLKMFTINLKIIKQRVVTNKSTKEIKQNPKNSWLIQKKTRKKKEGIKKR